MAAVMPESSPEQRQRRAVIPERAGSQYTAAQIREAAAHYVVLGHQARVSALTGIPERTMTDWRRTAWWEDLVTEIRAEKQDEIDARLTGFIDKAVDAQLDRLENGDYILDKANNLIRKPVGLRDITMSMAITFDKRQIMRNLPTTISGSNANELKALREQFASLTGKVIEGEVLE